MCRSHEKSEFEVTWLLEIFTTSARKLCPYFTYSLNIKYAHNPWCHYMSRTIPGQKVKGRVLTGHLRFLLRLLCVIILIWPNTYNTRWDDVSWTFSRKKIPRLKIKWVVFTLLAPWFPHLTECGLHKTDQSCGFPAFFGERMGGIARNSTCRCILTYL